jgi:NitT/TauT family transport system substrate-binding protein
MKRRTAVIGLAAAASAIALPARGQAATRIVFGYTAVTDFASVFIAAD